MSVIIAPNAVAVPAALLERVVEKLAEEFSPRDADCETANDQFLDVIQQVVHAAGLVGQVAEDMSIAIQYRLCALAGLLSAGRAAGSYARGGLLVRAT